MSLVKELAPTDKISPNPSDEGRVVPTDESPRLRRKERRLRSHELVQDPGDLLRRMTVPERLRFRPLGVELLDRVEDLVRLCPDEGVPAVLQGLDPLRLVAQRDAWYAEEVGLLLDPAAVRDDLRGPHQKGNEVQVVDRLDRLDLRLQAVPQVEGDEVLAGPRVDREHDGPPAVGQGFHDPRPGLLVV